MAQKVEVILVDDLDGGHADETIRFTVDNGTQYEIDLSSENASTFRNAMKPYVDAGRKVGRTKAAPAASRSQETARIREWANANGHKVASRGRINADIIEAYRRSVGQ